MNRILLLIASSLLLVASCNGPKYMVKQGQKSEKARSYEQALFYYSEANTKDASNRDALKGLKRAGQKLLNSILHDFDLAYTSGNYPSAISDFRKADNLVKNLDERGINLFIPDSVRAQYFTALSSHTRSLYLQAAKSVDAGNYENARNLVRDLEKLDPDYEGLNNLKAAIEAEPVYKDALSALRNGEKGKAMNYLLEVTRIYPDYRDSRTLMEDLKANSTVKLALFPFENQTREVGLATDLEKKVEAEFYKLNNPLLQFFTSSNLGFSYNGGALPDDKTLLSLGAASGMNKIVLGYVLDFKVEDTPRRDEYRTAYVRERVVYWDPFYGQSTSFQYRETRYRESTEETKVTVQLKYRLLDVKSGMTTYSDVLSQSVLNQVRYASYDGIVQDLYPTTGYISQNDLLNWRNRFSASRDKKPVSELIRVAEETIARDLANEMLSRPFQ